MPFCCKNCGKELNPVEAMMSAYCRECADRGHKAATGHRRPKPKRKRKKGVT